MSLEKISYAWATLNDNVSFLNSHKTINTKTYACKQS